MLDMRFANSTMFPAMAHMVTPPQALAAQYCWAYVQGGYRLYVTGTENMWRMFCAGFRHSAGFHARVVLDGVAFRLGEHGDVHDVLSVLGDDRVVPIVLCVPVSWYKEE